MKRIFRKSPMKLSRRRRGFTLVELVIVGALIAIFSSLAVFGVQQQFRSSLRKATIGETRNVAAALDFANLDTSVFPKLCFLTESREGVDFMASQMGLTTSNLLALWGNVDIAGRQEEPSSALTFAARVRTKWDGPYFAVSQSRAGVAQGRGGFVYMIMPTLPDVGPNNITQNGGFRWPSDPYNNPYVVYMLDIVSAAGSPPRLATVAQADEARNDFVPTRKGNFVNAVVSYGPNHFPGGDEYDRPDFGDRSAGVNAAGLGIWANRLYTGVVGFKPDAKGIVTHKLAIPAVGDVGPANVWGKDFAQANGVTLVNGVGISDNGSDDIVFEF